MPRSNCLNLLDPLLSDEPPSLREGFEPALQSESHAFEQTSVDDIGKRMPVQNSVKIRRETQSTGDLSQTSEEDFGAGHLGAWRQVLRVARIANDYLGRDPAQPQRRSCQTGCADHKVSRRGELLKIGRDLHLDSAGFELGGEPAQPLQVASAEQHTLHLRRQTTG